jgi:hypothetical protein
VTGAPTVVLRCSRCLQQGTDAPSLGRVWAEGSTNHIYAFDRSNQKRSRLRDKKIPFTPWSSNPEIASGPFSMVSLVDGVLDLDPRIGCAHHGSGFLKRGDLEDLLRRSARLRRTITAVVEVVPLTFYCGGDEPVGEFEWSKIIRIE